MATWIAHIRLAENLLKYGFELDVPSFLAGSVAPDSGIMTENGLVPPKNISHWKDMNSYIQPEDFYEKYLEGKTLDAKEYAFLMGYYLHLEADLEWLGNVWQPNRKNNALWKALDENNRDDMAKLKKDWYGLDFCYLDQHPKSLYFSHFVKIGDVPDYLDFFPKGYLAAGVQKVKDYYDDAHKLADALTHNYPYITESDLLTWIDCTTVTMMGLLKGKAVPCPNPKPLFGEKYIQTAL
jgi:hypothetical protein